MAHSFPNPCCMETLMWSLLNFLDKTVNYCLWSLYLKLTWMAKQRMAVYFFSIVNLLYATVWLCDNRNIDYPVRNSDFFLCATFLSCWPVHFHISLLSLKFVIFIHLSYSQWLWLCWSWQYAGHQTHMNSVECPCSLWVLVAQWLEHPPGVRKVRVNSGWGLIFFALSHFWVMLISSLYTFLYCA